MIEAAQLRADARQNVLGIARAIGWAADWRTGCSRPTLARLIDRSGLARRTVQYWCRWLEQRGLLAVTEPGTTPQYRPAILHRADSANLAREWQLTAPVDKSCTPSGYFQEEISTQAPERGSSRTDRRSAADSSTAPPLPQLAPWPLDRTPQRRSEALAAMRQLQRERMGLRQFSDRALRSQYRPFARAAWTPAEWADAIDHDPSGRQHSYTTTEVRSPSAWLASRLALWLDPATGEPRESRSQAVEREREQLLAEQAQRRAERALTAAAAAKVDVAGHATRAREMLRQRLSRGARRPALP